MADKKVRKTTQEEFAAHLAANKPAEEVILEINYSSGDEACSVEFHCKKSTLLFGRYIKNAYGPDGDTVQAGAQLLIDSVIPSERELIAQFINTYPAEAILTAAALSDSYGGGNIETAIKNVSKPAGN